MNVLDQIDRAIDGLCPCGAKPRDRSAYCGPDCEPTHIAEDTDAPGSGTPTPMRWRPDLVTAADDTDLIPLGSETHGYTGWFNAQVYERVSKPTTWHLRLDDGHRFVGLDLTDVGGRHDPITEELVGRVREGWQRLERELGNTRHLVPTDDDPWPELIPPHVLADPPIRRRQFGAQIPAWLRAPDSRERRHGIDYDIGDRIRVVRPGEPDVEVTVACVSPADGGEVHVFFGVDLASRPQARSYHNDRISAVDLATGSLGAAGRVAAQAMQPLASAAEAFLRDISAQLTDWQRQMLAQWYPGIQVTHPRRFGRSAPMQELVARLSFRPLVNAREAAILAQAGLREGLEFLRYPDTPERDEPPADPMLRAIEAKKHRNTGPQKHRLDGRRRRR